MDIFHHLAEKRIQEAIDRGDFQNLPGEGQPLDLKENPLEPPEMRMAINLLENNGFKLPWLEKLFEIRKEKERFRKILQSEEASVLKDTPAIQKKSRDKARQINKKILDYNISVPNEQLQIKFLDIDDFHAIN